MMRRTQKYDCPDAKRHTKCPKGYLAWHEWADKKARTHNCTQCPTCGLWTMWTPRKNDADQRGLIAQQPSRGEG